MGKSTKYPAYSTGSVSINGENKATTYKNGNNVTTNYNMSDTEKKIYNYAQNSFLNSLPQVNVFSDDTQKQLNNQLNAYTANGQKIINNLYTPMINNLKTDIASRFGNFDNSVFLDNLNSIESNRANSMNSLAQDVLAKRDELVNNELSQRYTYLNFLQDIQNQTNSNIMNYMGVSQQNSASGNSYNAQSYSAKQSNPTSSISNYANLASGLLSNLGPYGMAASGAIQAGTMFL